MKFTIVGLPRSRTSWLSVFMTWQGSFCIHEPMRLEKKNIDGYPRHVKHTGVSDSTYCLFPEEVPEDSNLVIINRPVSEVCKSLHRIGVYNCDKMIGVMWEGLSKIAVSRKHLLVQFSEINGRLELIWNHCLPGVSFPYKRAMEMVRLRIEPVVSISQIMNEVTDQRLEAIHKRLEGV